MPKAKLTPARPGRLESKKKGLRHHRPIIFASPSLRLQDLPGVASRAELRGPVRAADLAGAPAGALVAIIDAFDVPTGVAAEDIRKAISRGVRLVGAAGIGACYAVQIREMQGIGEIYRMYREAEIARMDEARVVFDEGSGLAKSEALVNVRFAVAELVRSGSLSNQDGRALTDAAIQLPVHERSYPNIFRLAGLSSKGDVSQLESILRSIDLRREDAVTLVESLPHLDRADDAAAAGEKANEGQQIKKTARADSSLMIWEYGEEVAFRTLLEFTATCGRLAGYTKGALLRAALSGSSPNETKHQSSGEAAQDLVDEISSAWGWRSSEELAGTLRELGFGTKELSADIRAEHVSRRRIRSLLREMPKRLLRSLRFELLVNDLALKREAMRLGALQSLADRATRDPTVSEVIEAKKALLATSTSYAGEETWSRLVASQGLKPESAEEIARVVARARSYGVPLIEMMDRAHAAPGTEPNGLADLPVAQYVPGTARSMRDSEGFEVSKQIARAIGISTVTQLADTTRIRGIHVTGAHRRHTTWDGAGSGKGDSAEGATVGAIMEEAEKYCQEMFSMGSTVTLPFDRWTSSDVVDPNDLYLPNDSSYDSSRALEWGTAMDLVSGGKVHVPLAALVRKRLQDDPYFSKRLSKKYFSTNGLASGFSITEALHHGICERVERHAFKLAEQDISNPGNLPGAGRAYAHIELSTCPPSTRRICAALQASGCLVRVIDVTCEVSIPTYFAMVFRPSKWNDDQIDQGLEFSGPGICAHSNPEVAINRAILEAVQCILVYFTDRSDTVLQVRSLGRHERPRPNALGELSRMPPWVPMRPYSTEGGFSGSSAREELGFLLRRVTAASFNRVLYTDLSREETMPARVVRVYIPGMEDINPVHTGIRARARIVADLLHRHEW